MRLLPCVLLLCAPPLWAADVTVVSLFPNNALTVADATQATGLRVDLPLRDCIVQPSTCAELSVLNELDGFSVNPRIAVRFSGPVDPEAVRSLILISPVEAPLDIIGLNQVVWDPATSTLYGKPDRVLDQRRRYRLSVFLPGQQGSSTEFTTMSTTAWLGSVRGHVAAAAPPPITRIATYRLSDIASLTLHQETHVSPAEFTDLTLPVNLVTGVGAIAFGSFPARSYLNTSQTIDQAPTAYDPGPGTGTSQLYFHALLPAAGKPASGYPVIIYGHGLGDSQWGGPSGVASIMGLSGFAIIGINAVGHGFGPDSTVQIHLKNGNTVDLTAGGRSIPDSAGAVAPYGGCVLAAPELGIRDCLRQTAVDLMQLVRVIKTGVDLDGDGTIDLDPNRVYYIGQSLGALYGTLLTAVEPDLPVAALNSGGGSTIDIARWSPAFHSLAQLALGQRHPALLNAGSDFNENYVLRDQPVKVNDVPGAAAIQDFFERLDWAAMPGDPLAFAHLLRKKKILFLFGRGDQTIPNPTESALVREADGRASTWLFRNDLARAQYPGLPENPHAYLTNILSGGPAQAIALATQLQIAGFFVFNGTKIPNPNTQGYEFFEIPGKLPEDLGFQ